MSGRRPAVSELLAALAAEFDRLADENIYLVKEVQLLSEHSPTEPELGRQVSFTASPRAFDQLDEVPPLAGVMPDNLVRKKPPPLSDYISAEAPVTLHGSCKSNGKVEAVGTSSAMERKSTVISEASVVDRKSTRRSLSAGTGYDFVTSSNTLEAEDRYENLYDLTRTFHSLCAPFSSSLGSSDLGEMHLNQANGDPAADVFEELCPRFDAAIVALNGRLKVMDDAEPTRPSNKIILDTFISIMKQAEKRNKDFAANVETDTLDAISEIRDILVKEDALRKVAKATNTSYGEIYQASRRRLVFDRMECVMRWLDPVIGFVIVLNAIVIGVSTDWARDAAAWRWLEGLFTLIFSVELLLKICGYGCRAFLTGPGWMWNILDACIVGIAICDSAITFVWSARDSEGADTPLRNFTVIRLLRFARLTRLVRVLRLKVFKELTLIVSGILAGFRTLIWAVVFLTFLMYTLGVILTTTLGHAEATEWDSQCGRLEGRNVAACEASVRHLREHRQELFGRVHRSMFTVFRCFTDGCASVDGTPLVPHFYNAFGAVSVGAYCIVFLFVIFGLFNLIMAVFVENTIENAKHDDARRREARVNEHLRIAKKLQEVIVLFCTGSEGANRVASEEGGRGATPTCGTTLDWVRQLFSTTSSRSGTESASMMGPAMTMSNLNLEVNHDAFTRMLATQEVQDMLDDLDISVSNRSSLFETLDANCNGTLEVSELVQGLLKLRGTVDKGDVIASLLAIRSVQKSIKAMELLGLHQQEVIEGIASAQDRVEATIAGTTSRPSAWRARRVPRGPDVAEVAMKAELSTPYESSTPTAVHVATGLRTMRADARRRSESLPNARAAAKRTSTREYR